MSGCRAQRVEAFLDDGGAGILAARIVAIVDREQRLAGGRPRRPAVIAPGSRARSRRMPPTGRDHLGADVAIGMLKEDGGPIAFEQDHRVVDQAECPTQVEPAPDIGGDAAQCLRPMKKVRDLVGTLGATDHRAERVGGDPDDSRSRGPSDRRLPTTWRTPHGSREPGIETASSGRPSGKTASGSARPASTDPGHRRATGPVPGRPRAAGSCRDPEPTG